MLGQSAAASTAQTMEWFLYNPIVNSMPAPYVWWEPSLLSSWSSQPGVLYNYGTAGSSANIGTSIFDQVQASDWTPPSGGTAKYEVNSNTLIEAGDEPNTVIPASDFTNGVTIVAMIRSDGDPVTGTVVVQVGLGGVGFGFRGTGGGNDYIVPGIYASGDLLNHTLSVAGGQPPSDNFRCYIATIKPDGGQTELTLYQNGSLTVSGSLGTVYESGAASDNIQIWAGNRFFFGSMLRFNYVVNQTQVNTITDYMRTIWGTLA